MDKDGCTRYFLNNAIGVIQDNTVLAVWGTQREITYLKEAELKIQSSLREKEILLKEIHHRVKNNMQIISSLLNLQLNDVLEKDEMSVRKAFIESRNRIHSMALVHQLLYQSDDFAKVDFRRYVQKLTANLLCLQEMNGNRIHTAIHIPDMTLTIEQAIPCGLIINELVLNALEHAFPPDFSSTKKIDIVMIKKGGHTVELTVKDNGVGLRKEIDTHAIESFGLTLVKTLAVEQLEGYFEISFKGGTICTVRFQQG
ncbi:sensor histidine kinase [bacterium]|nr:sensor histidine kinase [bacterium]